MLWFPGRQNQIELRRCGICEFRYAAPTELFLPLLFLTGAAGLPYGIPSHLPNLCRSYGAIRRTLQMYGSLTELFYVGIILEGDVKAP